MRFDHIAIACRDVEAMRNWYERVLGFQVRARKSPSRPDAPAATYLAGPGGSGAAVELTPFDGKESRGREPFTLGISHIALAVENFAEWEAKLDAAAVPWLGDAAEAMGGGKVRSFLDPEGNMLQIVERPRS